ncbi:thioesterase family protein [Nonomuraea jiangxiensis]|uniref:Acyl-CoA thioesterase n=1 Tax=Nonomuraea jiangxiensis TaxID=633440 RepID=A0A1G9FQQ1_9ACTN|nr:thioesterase family protein [Nonomuraea jiangxiensis]SDK90709.1 Acyl-CoA thioesterase [Nonomuraea jiangxiensis]
MGTFQEATALTARGDGEFDALLDAQWSVGTRLHGGYLLAVLGRAACESAAGAGHPHVTAVSASFVEPPEPGAALAQVETLRVGRSLAQVRAALVQEGRTRVEAHITLSRLDGSDPWWTAAEPAPMAPEEACFQAPVDAPGAGMPVPLMAVIENRLDPENLGFAFGTPAGRGVLTSWQRLADGSDWDPLSLLVALDPVPPVSLELGVPGWVPTIQLTGYVRRLPAPGPIRVRLTATDVGGDRMDEVAHVWDDKGRLVAQATQLAALRLPAPQ